MILFKLNDWEITKRKDRGYTLSGIVSGVKVKLCCKTFRECLDIVIKNKKD